VGDGNVRQAALDALGSGTDMAPIRQRLQAKGQDITQNVETAKDLQKKIGGKLLLMGLLVGGFCLAIYAGAKAGGFWGYVAAIVATILAVVAIAYIGKEILDLLKKLKDLPYNLGSGHDLMMGVSILTAALCGVALVMAWVKGGAAKKAAEEAAKKAAEEAALAAAGEAAGGTAAGAGGAAAGAGGAAASTGGASLATQVGVSVGSNMATTGATQVISADPSTAASVDPTKPLPADATEEQKILWNQLQQK
jgi:hypothetical protein